MTAIEHDNGHVVVHSTDGRWHGQQVAVCVPLAATSAIAFTPTLPAAQADLLGEVESPQVTKLVASLAPTCPPASTLSVGDPLLRLAMRGRRAALGFAYNQDATRPVEHLRTHLLDALGLDQQQLDGFVAHPWHEQPYALGGYPAFAPGQLTRHGPALRAAHGLIQFAGADRSTWPGTMEGAIRDGHRVADALLHRHTSRR